MKSASNTLSRKRQMFLKQASSRNLLIRPTKVSSIDHEWGHDFAIATGIHRDLLAGVGNGSELITLILTCDHASIEKRLKQKIQDITSRLQTNTAILDGVTSIAHYVNLRDEAGCCALHHICDKRLENPIPLVGMLLDVGAHIDTQASASGFTPLHLAIRRHQVGLALYLLERGAAANIKTLSEDADDDLPSAYEEGVEQSSSWWAFTQLTMIHEDDFKDSTTSPKHRLKCFFLSLIKCHGKEEQNGDQMHKLNKKYEDLLKKRDTRTSKELYVYKMKSVEE